MSRVMVKHLRGDAFQVDVRGHTLLADQPTAAGDEVGPTPVEFFVASLAACAAHYAVGFLRRRGLPHDGLTVECEWTMRAAQPPRVGRLRIRVIPPEPVPDELHEALLAAVDECTVKNSLDQPPRIEVELATSASAAV